MGEKQYNTSKYNLQKNIKNDSSKLFQIFRYRYVNNYFFRCLGFWWHKVHQTRVKRVKAVLTGSATHLQWPYQDPSIHKGQRWICIKIPLNFHAYEGWKFRFCWNIPGARKLAASVLNMRLETLPWHLQKRLRKFEKVGHANVPDAEPMEVASSSGRLPLLRIATGCKAFRGILSTELETSCFLPLPEDEVTVRLFTPVLHIPHQCSQPQNQDPPCVE